MESMIQKLRTSYAIGLVHTHLPQSFSSPVQFPYKINSKILADREFAENVFVHTIQLGWYVLVTLSNFWYMFMNFVYFFSFSFQYGESSTWRWVCVIYCAAFFILIIISVVLLEELFRFRFKLFCCVLFILFCDFLLKFISWNFVIQIKKRKKET